MNRLSANREPGRAEQHQGREVHILAIGMMALAFAVSLPTCKRASVPTLPAAPFMVRHPVAVDALAKREPAVVPPEPLCHGRPRCSMVERLPARDPEAGSIVVVRLAAPPNAASDEEHCNRREYWLSRPVGDLAGSGTVDHPILVLHRP